MITKDVVYPKYILVHNGRCWGYIEEKLFGVLEKDRYVSNLRDTNFDCVAKVRRKEKTYFIADPVVRIGKLDLGGYYVTINEKYMALLEWFLRTTSVRYWIIRVDNLAVFIIDIKPQSLMNLIQERFSDVNSDLMAKIDNFLTKKYEVVHRLYRTGHEFAELHYSDIVPPAGMSKHKFIYRLWNEFGGKLRDEWPDKYPEGLTPERLRKFRRGKKLMKLSMRALSKLYRQKEELFTRFRTEIWEKLYELLWYLADYEILVKEV